MLNLFEVRDLPLTTAVRVDYSRSTLEVLDEVRQAQARFAIFQRQGHWLVVSAEALHEAATRSPETPIALLELTRAVEVSPTLTLAEAVRAVASLSGIGALIVGAAVVTQHQLLGFNAWAEAVFARERRLANARLESPADDARVG